MKEFLRFYHWGMRMKSHMALYTMALLFFKGITGYLMGITTISIFTALQMLIGSMLVACIEGICFPEYAELEKNKLWIRTAIWAACANVIIIGGSAIFHWFGDVPLWGNVILIAMLELGLAAMWVGFHIAERLETRVLNKRLEEYHSHTL